VDKDKSMTAMIQNDVDKEWMMPLLDFRNELDFRSNGDDHNEASDHHLRDFRRLTGAVHLMAGGKPVPGPYTQASRERWLAKLLCAQKHIRQYGPPEVRNFQIVTPEEIQEIRRIWVIDKHELEDSLPRTYQESTGEKYPGRPLDDNMVLGEREMNDLAELCGKNRLHYELTRELLSLTRQRRMNMRRAGLFEQMEKTFRRHFYEDRADAITRAQRMVEERQRRTMEHWKEDTRPAAEGPVTSGEIEG